MFRYTGPAREQVLSLANTIRETLVQSFQDHPVEVRGAMVAASLYAVIECADVKEGASDLAELCEMIVEDVAQDRERPKSEGH